MAPRRAPQGQLSTAESLRTVVGPDHPIETVPERHQFADIVGTSRLMGHVCEQIAHAARASVPVLLWGEPGTGKTLAARAIHSSSSRSVGPFVAVNCTAMPETVLGSHPLVGSTGAFASPQFADYVQRAVGGTLVLDEIADLGPLAQERLSRLIEERTVENEDGTIARADVRLIASSRRHLEEPLVAGLFRRDVYERLMATMIVLPPLRDRKTDVCELATLFVEVFAREHSRRVDRLSARAMELLESYAWPGNVAELSRVIERAVVMTSGPVIHHHHLPAGIQQASRSGPVAPLALSEALDAYEKELLEDALRQTHGVRSKAARRLGTTERILTYRLRKHRIDWHKYKATR